MDFSSAERDYTSNNSSRRVTFGDVTHIPAMPEEHGAQIPGLVLEHVPVDFAITLLGSSPMDVAMSCRMFLDTQLPASVSKLPCDRGQKWHVKAIVFVDSVPLTIELRISEAPVGGASVAINHSSRSDVVRFRRVCEMLVNSLRASGFKVADRDGICCVAPSGTWAGLVDDDFEDDSPEKKAASWRERVELAMDDFDSNNAVVREETIQTLARWAVSAPASHLTIANGLSKRSDKVGLIFFSKSRAPLTKMYPMAAALRSLACNSSAEVNVVLRNSPLPRLLNKYKRLVTGLPPLVAGELISVSGSLQDPRDRKPTPGGAPCLSTISKCSTKLGSNQCHDDGSTKASGSSPSKSSMHRMTSSEASLSRQTPSKLRQMLHVTDMLFESTESWD